MVKSASMTGWTPLFQRIVCSSLWDQGDHVRLAWVTMLALSTKEGVVPIKSPAALARMARIDLAKAEDAILVLSSKDPLAPEGDLEEGKRITAHPNGWQIVKWSEYRELAKAAMRRENNANYQAVHRAKLKDEEVTEGNDVTPGDAPLPKKTKEYEIARQILHHLNQTANRKFREVAENLDAISARLNEKEVTQMGFG